MSGFKPNPNFEKEIAGAAQGAARVAGHAVAEKANQLAHHAMPRKGHGAPIVVEHDGLQTRVANTNHGGHLEEWGATYSPPYAPLRRAVRALRLRFTELGK